MHNKKDALNVDAADFFSAEIFLAAVSALATALVFEREFGKFATAKLGGVTGDIYGAAEFLSEVSALAIFLLAALHFLE